MAKEEGIEMEGVVQEVLPDRNYRVLLENGHTILAYAAGKMSKFKIRVLEGDRVSVAGWSTATSSALPGGALPAGQVPRMRAARRAKSLPRRRAPFNTASSSALRNSPADA